MWVFGGVFEINLNIAEILTAASTFSRPLWFALDLINASRLAGHGTRWVFPSFSHHFPLGRCMMDLKRSQKEFVYVITPKKGKRNMNHKTFVLCFQKAKGPWTPKTFDFIWCSFVFFWLVLVPMISWFLHIESPFFDSWTWNSPNGTTAWTSPIRNILDESPARLPNRTSRIDRPFFSSENMMEEIRPSPVEVGRFIPLFTGFFTSKRWLGMGFLNHFHDLHPPPPTKNQSNKKSRWWLMLPWVAF